MPSDVLLKCPLNIPGKAAKRAGVASTQRWAAAGRMARGRNSCPASAPHLPLLGNDSRGRRQH